MAAPSTDNIRVFELQAQIGLSESTTDKVLSSLTAMPRTVEFLPVYDLLLLERFSETVPLIRSALEEPQVSISISDYLSTLQGSTYYFHRMAVPSVLRGAKLPTEVKRDFLRRSLTDPIYFVVAEAVETIVADGIFDREDLLDIAKYLSIHEHTVLRLLTVDILTILREDIPLLETVLNSSSWRVRLRAARLVKKFSEGEQRKIVSTLSADPIEEVRVHLACNIDGLDHLYFLDDQSERVRAAYLSNIIEKLEDESVFKRLIDDNSWEVKKILLNLKGEWLQRVTIPLIKMSTVNVKWRIKYDILCLVEEKIAEEHVVRPLFEFILESVQDKTCEVRNKAGDILKKLIETHSWSVEYEDSISRVVASRNYLHRISILPAAALFDRKTGSSISLPLKDDRVVNVREYYHQIMDDRSCKG